MHGSGERRDSERKRRERERGNDFIVFRLSEVGYTPFHSRIILSKLIHKVTSDTDGGHKTILLKCSSLT